ncbi:hypothetical protein IFM60648_07858 [Aspergillus lentulus]|uniref:Uncharacterized protein n=1 Tax=Aspergillus lentulus TaxID=293939 RepID=A0ABQ1ARQ8_ASPLE|nr:hypothetical protein IFM60648_07858 [Aspergillus lentulus]
MGKKSRSHWWFQRYIITYANTAIAFLIGPFETPTGGAYRVLAEFQEKFHGRSLFFLSHRRFSPPPSRHVRILSSNQKTEEGVSSNQFDLKPPSETEPLVIAPPLSPHPFFGRTRSDQTSPA